MTDPIPVTLVLYRDGSAEIQQHEWRPTEIEDGPDSHVIVDIRAGD